LGEAQKFFFNMQIKIYAIPIPGGDATNEEMNKFLRSKQVLQVDQHVVSNEHGNYWCFSIRYLDAEPPRGGRRVDYREVLDEATFKRFARMREIRKQLAAEDEVLPFIVFTDEELAAIANLPLPLTEASIQGIKGIGDKKMEKYGQKLLKILQDEK
jgi:superfamily II DNA helicase RecQ